VRRKVLLVIWRESLLNLNDDFESCFGGNLTVGRIAFYGGWENFLDCLGIFWALQRIFKSFKESSRALETRSELQKLFRSFRDFPESSETSQKLPKQSSKTIKILFPFLTKLH
jgi:hypothetical protein